MDNATRIGFGIMLGLALSAAAVVALVVGLGVPIWAGLLMLAVLDIVIIVWGYAAVRRSFRPG